MEAMLAADQLATGQDETDDAPGPLPGEEEAEELNEEEMAAKYQQAIELNMQLKAMMMQAEEQQRREMQRRAQQQRGGGGGQRAMVDTRRQEGGAMFRGQAPAAPGPRPDAGRPHATLPASGVRFAFGRTAPVSFFEHGERYTQKSF